MSTIQSFQAFIAKTSSSNVQNSAKDNITSVGVLKTDEVQSSIDQTSTADPAKNTRFKALFEIDVDNLENMTNRELLSVFEAVFELELETNGGSRRGDDDLRSAKTSLWAAVNIGGKGEQEVLVRNQALVASYQVQNEFDPAYYGSILNRVQKDATTISEFLTPENIRALQDQARELLNIDKGAVVDETA